MKNIQAIIFDLGAVILNINYQNTIDAFAKLGVKTHLLFIPKKHKPIYLINLTIGEAIAILFLDRVQQVRH